MKRFTPDFTCKDSDVVTILDGLAKIWTDHTPASKKLDLLSFPNGFDDVTVRVQTEEQRRPKIDLPPIPSEGKLVNAPKNRKGDSMPTTVKRIQTVDVSLATEPGSLARVFSAFREAGVNVIASWGYEMGPGEAKAHFYVNDLTKTKDTLAKMGLKTQLTDACWIEGDDKVGAYAELLGKVSKAGVNIGATDAFSINGKFASVLFAADSKKFPEMCKALNI